MVEAVSPSGSTDFPDRLMARVKWTERLHKLDPANRDNLYGWEAMLDAEKQTEARDVLKALLDEFPMLVAQRGLPNYRAFLDCRESKRRSAVS